MGKKGFTLIELIAVIVILALIALIVFPAINSVIRSSREDTYKTQIATIEKAAKQLSYENTFVLPDEVEDSQTTLELSCLLSGCDYNGQHIAGGYLNEEDIIDPRNTKKKLEGHIVITYESKQYTYQYTEESTKNTIGAWLLENDDAKAVLKANDGVYKGSNVENYVNFSGSTWRILKINDDNTITLVKNSESAQLSWDNTPATFSDSALNTYLNKTYYNSLSQKKLIKPKANCIGPTDNPCSETYTANVGLLTTTDYVEASNDVNCSVNNNTCKNGNYLSNYSIANGAEYTMTQQGNQIESISNGLLTAVNPNTVLNIRPVVTLKNTTKITGGSGESDNPYTVG